MTAVYPIRSKQVAARLLGGEMMIMSPRDTTLFNLNDVGAAIWKCADGRTSIDEIVGRLCSEFDVTPDAARRDAETFLQEMVTHGIMFLAEQPTAEVNPQETK